MFFFAARGYDFRRMKVHEIMTSHPRGVSPANTLVEAAGLMRQLDVGALPVCEGDRLMGMLTDRDLVVRGIADGLDPNAALVSEVMSGGIETVSADDEVERAVQMMEMHQIRRLPVLNRERKLVGMISLGDVATSSNPAFSGIALRDVSRPNDASERRRRLARESEPPRMPEMAGGRHGTRSEARNRGAGSVRTTSRRAAARTRRARSEMRGKSKPQRSRKSVRQRGKRR